MGNHFLDKTAKLGVKPNRILAMDAVNRNSDILRAWKRRERRKGNITNSTDVSGGEAAKAG